MNKTTLIGVLDRKLLDEITLIGVLDRKLLDEITLIGAQGLPSIVDF